MNITIYLITGQTLSATVEGYNAAEFAKSLNNPQIIMANIGDVIVNKNAVQMIIPSDVVSQSQ